ncbi:L-aspartate oxidase [Alkalibacillus aidingensis]|uniref:L-aspartate oxidase n=1 Tax=Alkalibacillus aidingensis TaxID=2747607 RepID=UPI0016606D51|nr:L-aspartate oxidase [Alkalibacillus aidingensis]
MQHADVIIIGSGIAALQLASRLRNSLKVVIITKGKLNQNNSARAQGGVAAAIGRKDHFHAHSVDTLEAGRYINDYSAVEYLTIQAPDIIQDLLNKGCSFDYAQKNLALGKEGAHSHHRIVHAGGDQTGKHIVETLMNQLGDHTEVIENAFAYQLLVNEESNQCYGVKYKDDQDHHHELIGTHTVLATGGCGAIYSYTSNHPYSLGDGVALAYLAGATVSDLEFIQFHPTLLSVDEKGKGLISEAVRGEGAILVNSDQERFMEYVHPLKELAPRHVVSQAIYQQISRGKQVYLDISPIRNFHKRFPSITKMCNEAGVDMSRQLIPVTPGAHFMIGGINANLSGETTINNLYAIGEVANTRIHGANRLASNSLLEGLVMGRELAININHTKHTYRERLPKRVTNHNHNTDTLVSLPSLSALREAMMENVGIVRTQEALSNQIKWLENCGVNKLTSAHFDQASLTLASKGFAYISAYLISQSAIQRQESRGAHYRRDFPLENDLLKSLRIQHSIERREYLEQV